MGLTKEQQEVSDSIIEIVNGPETAVIKLLAPGGYGKTFSARDIIARINNASIVTSPTHNACKALAKAGVYAQTVAKFLGWTEDFDRKGKSIISYKNRFQGHPLEANIKDEIRTVGLILVDECSMVKREEIEMILEFLPVASILFMGDLCQLNPVKEGESILSNINCATFTLTKNMRLQNNPEVLAHLDSAREAVINETPVPYDYHYDPEHFVRNMYDTFKHSAKDSICICFRKETAITMNKLIRNQIFGTTNAIKNKFMVGESLVFTGHRSFANPAWEKGNAEPMFISYHSNDPIQVVESTVSDFTFRFNDNINSGKITIKMYRLIDQRGTQWLQAFDENELIKVQQLIESRRQQALFIGENDHWKLHKSFIQSIKADILYSYSINVHKAQGNGYDNVFVLKWDVDCLINLDIDDWRKAYYTCVSRTKKTLEVSITDFLLKSCY